MQPPDRCNKAKETQTPSKRPRRLAALQQLTLVATDPPKSAATSVKPASKNLEATCHLKNREPINSSELAKEQNEQTMMEERSISFNVPVYDDLKDIDPSKCSGLEPLPPKRKRLGRKSIFCRRRKLDPDEFHGSQSLSMPDFWDTLGNIRPKTDIFSWGKSIGYRRHMGRVYFDSFKLCEKTLRVGDFVSIKDKFHRDEFFRIVSAFQATRSFVGRWMKKEEELQNRGFAYVELVKLKHHCRDRYNLYRAEDWSPNHVEGLPTVLVEGDGQPCIMERVDIQCSQVWLRKNVREELSPYQHALLTESDAVKLASRFASNDWPKWFGAEFVVLYNNLERDFSLGTKERFTEFDSDDSDCFDEASRCYIQEGKKNWNEELGCDDIDEDLEPAFMFSGSLLPEKDVDSKRLYETLKLLEPLLNRCVEYDESLSNIVAAFRKEIFLRTATARLDDYFDIKHVPGACGGPVIRDEYAKLGFPRYKSKIQQLACEDVVASREDTIVIAPCGSGKSLAFVHAALCCGGKVNIVIEPLNALIKSQLAELSKFSAYLDIEQLFTEDEARTRKVPSSFNRLQIIINETKVSRVDDIVRAE